MNVRAVMIITTIWRQYFLRYTYAMNVFKVGKIFSQKVLCLLSSRENPFIIGFIMC